VPPPGEFRTLLTLLRPSRLRRWGETLPPTLLTLPGGPTEAEYAVNVSPEKLAKYLNGNREKPRASGNA